MSKWNEVVTWSEVEIPQTSGKNIPFVSIGRGQLDFNAAACDLVNDDGNSYRYAKLLTAKENGKTVVAVRFLEESEPNTIHITRKAQHGKPIKGMTVVNKGTVSMLFGKDGAQDGATRYKVEKIDHNMLKIIA